MKPIKTAILSYGMSGKIFQAPFLTLHPGFEFIGSWERSKKLVQTDYPEVKSYASLDDVLTDDTELIVVNTPIDSHFEYSKKALEAGKHLLVEKAFTTTVKEAEELVELAKKKQLTLTVYQNRRWDSDFKTVKKILNDGALGEIVEAEIRFDRYQPGLSTKAWKEVPTASTGILKDLGPHIIDQALCLFGLPEAVFADIRVVRELSKVDDHFDILLYYSNKRVRLHSGLFNKEVLPAYILQGRNGSFIKYRGDIQETVLTTGVKPSLENWGIEPKELEGIIHLHNDGNSIRKKIPTLPGNYYDIFDGVYRAIREGEKEPVEGIDGLHVMRVIEAAVQSSQEKRAIFLE